MFVGNLVESCFDARVNCGVVEEGDQYCFEDQEGVHSGCLLSFNEAIDWCITLVRGMLGSGGRYMLKFIEGAVEIVIYGDEGSDFVWCALMAF